MFRKDDILTIQEVAKVLKVSTRTVYRWVDTGDLKVARIGRKTYRVFESDLRKFIRKYME
ncbi:helix-turn-helix domain-containing protein [Candidatus Parcubacteria bacterium]|nr:helix-turn-helix domain-containing protein [Candidatus Parcubacteria bacterium]